MKKIIAFMLVFLLCSSLTYSVFPQQSNPFASRRQKVIEYMSPRGIMILQTPREGYRFGFNFHQNSDLYYLTGMNDEGIMLILSKPGIKFPSETNLVHSILIANLSPQKMSSKKPYYQLLQDSLHVDLVCGLKDFRKILKQVSNIDTLYTNILRSNQKCAKTILEKRLTKFLANKPEAKLSRPSRLTGSLRRIKDEREIELIRKAVAITMAAHRQAFKSMQPGLYEYQIEALIEFVFKFRGSQQLSFPTIVGAGPNSIILHYEKGERLIQAGDMVVMDIGCEYEHYCADLTRTIPATGKFSPQQKEIYNIVLEANDEIINNLRPGLTLSQLDSIQRAVIGKYGYEKYIRHGPSHYLGLDVHDVGDLSKPLAPGCVITVEPGIYIPPNSDLPEAYWNIGVRIEDDVLITKDGCIVLSADLPKTIDKIEELMKQDGLGNMEFN